MSIKAYRPTTPAQRQKTTQDFDQITTRKPLKSLLKAKKQNAQPRTHYCSSPWWWCEETLSYSYSQPSTR